MQDESSRGPGGAGARPGVGGPAGERRRPPRPGGGRRSAPRPRPGRRAGAGAGVHTSGAAVVPSDDPARISMAPIARRGGPDPAHSRVAVVGPCGPALDPDPAAAGGHPAEGARTGPGRTGDRAARPSPHAPAVRGDRPRVVRPAAPVVVRPVEGRTGGSHPVEVRLTADRTGAAQVAGRRMVGRDRRHPVVPGTADRPQGAGGQTVRAVRRSRLGRTADAGLARVRGPVHGRVGGRGQTAADPARTTGAGAPTLGRSGDPVRALRRLVATGRRRAAVGQPRPLSTRRRQR